jgi:5-methylcytosine-specific restriction endonuclease McrA
MFDGNPLGFHNLPANKKQEILDYELSIYVCEGEPSEKLDWFRIINIAGMKLTDQELRNAIYTGPWLADAKKWFSKSGCPAAQIGDKYINGSPIRQELLETALEWISGDKVDQYMAAHQHDENASALWQHYQEVIAWVERIFPTYRSKMMKGLDWGKLYREHGQRKDLNAAKLEKEIEALILDEEVEAKKGIYEYLLTGNEKTLSLRMFSEKIKIAAFEKQKGMCPMCKKTFEYGNMEADHIVPWHKGGKTEPTNCQMLCMLDNRTKSGK